MTSRHPFPVGAVAALGLSTGKCPVGLIEGADQTHVRLALLSFVTGNFSAGEITVNRNLIEEALFALPIKGRGTEKNPTVFDIDPLADYQTWWVANADQG